VHIQIDPVLLSELQKTKKAFADAESDPRIVRFKREWAKVKALAKGLADGPSMAELLFPSF
jgi:hypothetical protein